MRDTGVGIAPEILPRIFDLFTQARTIAGPLAGRAGHRAGPGATPGGDARRDGGGSQRFGAGQRVRRASAGGARSATAAARRLRRRRRQPAGPSLRVLVVDDNVDTADSLAMLLQDSGHDVRTAYDGSAAAGSGPRLPAERGAAGHRLAGARWLSRWHRRVRLAAALQNVVLVAMTGYGESRPAAFHGSRVRSPPGQACRPGQFEADPGGRYALTCLSSGAAAARSAAICCSAACNSRAGCSDPPCRARDPAPSRSA